MKINPKELGWEDVDWIHLAQVMSSCGSW